MPKFRKKPVVIEAEQFTENVALKVLVDKESGPFGLHVNGNYHPENRTVSSAWITIKTFEGKVRVDIGEWIIRGAEGEFDWCDPDIFEATYEPVEETA